MEDYIYRISQYELIGIENPSFLSLDIIKEYLRLPVTVNLTNNNLSDDNRDMHADDLLINIFIFAAIDYAERLLRVHLLTRQIACNIQIIYSCNKYYLPITPAHKIMSLQDQECKNISAYLYQLSSEGKILLFDKRYALNDQNVTVRYNTSTLSEREIKHFILPGLLLHISELYDHRIVSKSAFDNINQIYQRYRKILI